MATCCKRLREEFRLKNFLLGHDDPQTFVQFQCGWQKAYLAWRVFWACYHVTWIIVTGVRSWEWAGHDPDQQIKWFIYLTDWCYFVLTVSALSDVIVVAFIFFGNADIRSGDDVFVHAKSNTPSKLFELAKMVIQSLSVAALQDFEGIYSYVCNSGRDLMGSQAWSPWYVRMNWVLFTLGGNAAIVVSITYWALVYEAGNTITAVDIATHALNAIYVIINVSVTGVPMRLFHFYIGILYALIYVIFSYIYFEAGGTNHREDPYIYEALDWRDPGTTVGYAAVVTFVLSPIVHVFLFVLHSVKMCVCGNERGDNRESVDLTDLSRKY